MEARFDPAPERDPTFTRISPYPHTDIRLDESLRFTNEHQQRINEAVVPEVLKSEKRVRRRKEHDRIALGFIVSMIVANALKAANISADARIHYSRKRNTYSDAGKGLYYPSFLGSKALCGVIDIMAAGGWLDSELGTYDPKIHRGTRSTFKITEKLITMCAAIGISHHAARQDAVAVLRLKDEHKKLIFFDRAKHRQASDLVIAYNRFIGQQELGLLNLPRDEWERARAERRLPHFSDVSLYRVFNNGDWHQGGRFYGGWWQAIYSDWREFILINGERTVELDYSGFLTRAIYHAAGIDYREDPYDIRPIRDLANRKGIDGEAVRTNIKLATNILINAKPGVGLGRMSDLKMPKGISKKRAFELVTAHHGPIADKFRCGEGVRIMYRESTICQNILTDGVAQGIAVLPVHDSYIVQSGHRDWLYERMATRYREELGFDAVIKDKPRQGWKDWKRVPAEVY